MATAFASVNSVLCLSLNQNRRYVACIKENILNVYICGPRCLPATLRQLIVMSEKRVSNLLFHQCC
jgi:hypothetical protein